MKHVDPISRKSYTKDEKLFELTTQVNLNKYLDKESNYKIISKECNRDAGEIVDIYGRSGILCGAVIDFDDYYYLIMDKDKKISFHSCCIGYKILQDEDIGPDLSVLLWLRENDPDSLLELVSDCINRNAVLPISKIRVKTD
jgi:hypothetical protein